MPHRDDDPPATPPVLHFPESPPHGADPSSTVDPIEYLLKTHLDDMRGMDRDRVEAIIALIRVMQKTQAAWTSSPHRQERAPSPVVVPTRAQLMRELERLLQESGRISALIVTIAQMLTGDSIL